MKRILRSVFALVLAISSLTAGASIIYDVNRTIGGGTVTGFVETDGTLGVLAIANITNWVLTLTSPNLASGPTQTISFAAQTQTNIGGTNTTATATQLLFDFSFIGNGFFLLQGALLNFWCLDAGGCTGLPDGEYMGFNANGNTAAESNNALSGQIVFASVSPTAVSEPGTLAILLAGLGVLGFMARRTAKK